MDGRFAHKLSFFARCSQEGMDRRGSDGDDSSMMDGIYGPLSGIQPS
ncbi:MAG: hypothetical protein ACTHY9_11080 [Sphingobacterium sp.]